MYFKNILSLLSIILLVFTVNGYILPKGADGEDNKGDIAVFKIDGAISPVVAEYIKNGINGAIEKGFYAVVIQIDTPGGLDSSMRVIVKDILNSDIPIIVYVSPSGARAASAGTFITYASHIAVMSPGTNIGAAHPVGIGPGKSDSDMMKKVENDAVAYLVSIAEKRGRNKKWAEDAVRKSVSISETTAKELKVIDFIAANMEELIERSHGIEIVVGNSKIKLDIKGRQLVSIDMSMRQRILDTISNPNVAYILMLLGLVGLYFELATPGAILPGVIGAISLVLAFYAFQTLPINYAGLLLIILGMIMLLAEIKITSNGVLTIGGIASVVLGSLLLINREIPYLRISWAVILPTTAAFALFTSLTMLFAIKARKKRPMGGKEGLIGEKGIAVTQLMPNGNVLVHGELWSAVSEEPIKEGEEVVITEVNGLKLKVKKYITN